nr:PREDICTED: CD160 antigen-like [Apteryx mantelli mantelli]
MKYVEEGGTLTLNCTMRHRQDQSSQLEAHWYKKARNQNDEMGFGKELECLQLSHSSDPSTSVVSFLLLKIQSVNQSDSGRYQCRAKIVNDPLTAMGHFIRVNVTGTSIVSTTERTEGNFQSNKALSVDSQLKMMWAVLMVFWIIVYVKVRLKSWSDGCCCSSRKSPISGSYSYGLYYKPLWEDEKAENFYHQYAESHDSINISGRLT